MVFKFLIETNRFVMFLFESLDKSEEDAATLGTE